MEMVRTNLASMSIDELLKLREDVGRALSRKAAQLRDQLSRLAMNSAMQGEVGEVH
jgi:hypothetical protein